MDYKLGDTVAARRRVRLHLVDAADGMTPEIGEAGGQPQVEVNGGGFVNTAGVLVSLGNGAYYVQLTAAELSAVGSFMVRYKSANTAEFQTEHNIKVRPFGDEVGDGTIVFTWTELTSGAIPIDNVQVEFSTDALKANVVASGFTNAFGQLQVLLDPGTYYVWRSKAGYNPTTPNPITQVVS